MKPGVELDKLIHKHVFGYNDNFRGRQVVEGLYDVYGNEINIVDTKPSTDISAAWEVVEKLKDEWETVQISSLKNPRNRVQPKEWWCCSNYNEDEFQDEDWAICEIGLSAPHAICLAALKAKGVEI